MTRPKSPFLRGSDLLGEFLPIGHRGARAYCPENTLAGFELALELGARMVELDVHLTRDGHAVVFHDHHLRRCTDAVVRFPGRAPWMLHDFSWEELSKLDAGSWFVHDQPFSKLAIAWEKERYLGPERLSRLGCGQVRIPTLEEVLIRLDAADVAANIELKSIPYYAPRMGKEVLRTVEQLGLEHRVLLSSFDHELVRELKRAEPGIACGVLSRERLAAPVQYLTRVVGADTFHPGARPTYDTLGLLHHRTFGGDLYSARVAEFREAGLGVYCWTVDNPDDIRDLKDAGVSGIMSDFPNRLQDDWLVEHGAEVTRLQVD